MHRSVLIVAGSVLLALGTAACGKTSKTGLTTGLDTHKDRTYGFSFRYPAGWRQMRGPNRQTRVVLGDGRGTSCNVVIRRLKMPATPSGKPRNLNRYIKALTRQRLAARYPAKYRARISSFRTVRFGGQAARRIVVHLTAGGRQFSAVQHVTWRNFGVVTLNCGAPAATYRTAETRRHFADVARSFRF